MRYQSTMDRWPLSRSIQAWVLSRGRKPRAPQCTRGTNDGNRHAEQNYPATVFVYTRPTTVARYATVNSRLSRAFVARGLYGGGAGLLPPANRRNPVFVHSARGWLRCWVNCTLVVAYEFVNPVAFRSSRKPKTRSVNARVQTVVIIIIRNVVVSYNWPELAFQIRAVQLYSERPGAPPVPNIVATNRPACAVGHAVTECPVGTSLYRNWRITNTRFFPFEYASRD